MLILNPQKVNYKNRKESPRGKPRSIISQLYPKKVVRVCPCGSVANLIFILQNLEDLIRSKIHLYAWQTLFRPHSKSKKLTDWPGRPCWWRRSRGGIFTVGWSRLGHRCHLGCRWWCHGRSQPVVKIQVQPTARREGGPGFDLSPEGMF